MCAPSAVKFRIINTSEQIMIAAYRSIANEIVWNYIYSRYFLEKHCQETYLTMTGLCRFIF